MLKKAVGVEGWSCPSQRGRFSVALCWPAPAAGGAISFIHIFTSHPSKHDLGLWLQAGLASPFLHKPLRGLELGPPTQTAEVLFRYHLHPFSPDDFGRFHVKWTPTDFPTFASQWTLPSEGLLALHTNKKGNFKLGAQERSSYALIDCGYFLILQSVTKRGNFVTLQNKYNWLQGDVWLSPYWEATQRVSS